MTRADLKWLVSIVVPGVLLAATMFAVIEWFGTKAPGGDQVAAFAVPMVVTIIGIIAMLINRKVTL